MIETGMCDRVAYSPIVGRYYVGDKVILRNNECRPELVYIPNYGALMEAARERATARHYNNITRRNN